METVIRKTTIIMATCALFMGAFTSCSQTNEEKKDAAIAKIEKAMKANNFSDALEMLDLIPSEFTAEINAYEHKIKEAQIKNNFERVWDRRQKELAFRNNIADMAPYVSTDYLLTELLKLEYFKYDEEGYTSDCNYKFTEYHEDDFQYQYDSAQQSYNYCADGWNKALQNIALIAAKNEDYATANRCLSEFKSIMTMASRTYRRTTQSNSKTYDFRAKLVASPLKAETLKKVQAVKMIKDIEREFNEANFSRGSSQLSDSAKAVLNKLVRLLAQDNTLSVKFIGHTSADGNPDLNEQLSKDRARAAANYLESKGINYIRIGYEGKGSTQLKNTYDPTSEENCRIEIILL